jgi:hypothetical protein
VIKLVFQNREFVESSATDTGIFVELERTTKQVRLVLSRGTSLIARRTAMRQAESIARSGFLLANGERIGRGWKLVIDEEGSSLPDRLVVSPRVSYSETAKSFGTTEDSTRPDTPIRQKRAEPEPEPEPELQSEGEVEPKDTDSEPADALPE